MCGLIGFSSEDNSNTDKLQLLMYMNSIERGTDNTGFYTTESGIKKDNDKASLFLKKNKLPESKLFIGHVRKGSIGGKLPKHSHPFEYDNIVLAHNGTLENHYVMLSETKLNVADYDVDSQILCKLIDENTKDESSEIYDSELNIYYNYFDVLTKFLGSAALIFHDKRYENRLYVFKTFDRPLYNGMIDNKMYMSSLEESLVIIGCTEIKSFLSNNLYIIEDGIIIKQVLYKLKEKIYFSPNIKANNYDSYYNHNNYNKSSDFINARYKNIRSLAVKNSNDFIGKHYKPLASINSFYNNQNVKIDKNTWYLILNNYVENNWDLQIIDDNNKVVKINKFLFDDNSCKIEDCVYIVCDIYNSVKNDTTSVNKLVFKEGDIVEVIDTTKDTYVEVISNITSTSYHINISQCRPTNVIETEKFKNSFKEVIDTKLNLLLEASNEDISDEKEQDLFKDFEYTDESEIIESDAIDINIFQSFIDQITEDFDFIYEDIINISKDNVDQLHVDFKYDIVTLKEKCYEFKKYLQNSITYIVEVNEQVNC